MKQPTILAIFFLMLTPFVLCAQESANDKTPLINETSKEKISNAIMKTAAIQPLIVLKYSETNATMNTTHKEELKNPAGKAKATAASPKRKSDNKARVQAMNLSSKEKMRMGL